VAPYLVTLRSGDDVREVRATYVAPGQYDVRLAAPEAIETAISVVVRFSPRAAATPHAFMLAAGDRTEHATVVPNEARRHVFLAGRRWDLEVFDPLDISASADAAVGGLRAPMPGKVVAHLVAPGTPVKKGAPLMVLEAMKMELTVSAAKDGVLESFRYAPGEQVSEGAELAVFAESLS
jgi:3-methylcrotonyl-CoA carboxylase alpha subunit